MKKRIGRVLALSLSLALILSLFTACGSDSDSSDTAEAADTAETADTAEADEVAEATEVSEDAITLVFSMNDPETSSMYTDIFKPWFDRITEETDGLITIECHFNEELVSLSDAYDAVCKGTVDMAFVRNSSISCSVLDNLFENTYPSNECTQTALVYSMLYDEFPELGEQYSDDCTWLLHFTMTPGYIGLTSGEPAASSSDLSGLKLITASTLQTSTATALGAAGIDVAPPDFYSSLEKGVCDGAITTTLPEMVSYSWADVIHAVTLVPMLQGCAGVIINTDTWNSLPESARTVIENMHDEIVAMTDEAIQAMNAEALNILETDDEYDVSILEPSDAFLAELNEVSDQVVAEELENLDSQGYSASEIYARYLELTREYVD